MKNTIYTLPQDTFVAGQTCKYAWRLYRKSGSPFEASNCEGKFALMDYSHKEDEPIFTKEIEFVVGDEGAENIAMVTIEPEDTLYLSGKYIYQLSIKDERGNIEIPNQGIFYISNNIHKSFVG